MEEPRGNHLKKGGGEKRIVVGHGSFNRDKQGGKMGGIGLGG